MSKKLDYDRIRRVMMLFDRRWINENFEAYFPEAEEIHEFAHMTLGKAVTIGRIQGVSSIRDRGFSALYSQNNLGNEIIGLQYILTEASNLP